MADAVCLARIADGAGVDDVALVRLQREVLRAREMHGSAVADDGKRRDVRVSDEHQLGVRGREVRGGALGVVDVVELRRIDEVAVRGNRAVEFAGVGKGLQPREVGGRQDLAMARHGIGGEAVERLRRAAPGDRVIVVAREDNGHGRAQARNGFGRQRAVAHDIAEADDARRAVLCGIGERAVKRLGVGVDVGEDGVFHCDADIISKMSAEKMVSYPAQRPKEERRGF